MEDRQQSSTQSARNPNALDIEGISQLIDSFAQFAPTARKHQKKYLATKGIPPSEIYALIPKHATTERARSDATVWTDNFMDFAAHWAKYPNQPISDDLPFAQWVHKQRRRLKLKWLPDHQKKLLDHIRFPFEAPKIARTPNNMDYAKTLVAFHKENGHYAPTDTFGGAGLTKWLRKMNESRGNKGIVTATDSPSAALGYIRENIPDFKWEDTRKNKFNESYGLRANGLPAKEPRDRSNTQEKARFMRQIQAPVPDVRWVMARHDKPYVKAVIAASEYNVPIWLQGTSERGSGWVIGAKNGLLLYVGDDGNTRTAAPVKSSLFASPNEAHFDDGYQHIHLYNDWGSQIGTLVMDWLYIEQYTCRAEDPRTTIAEDGFTPLGRVLSIECTRFKTFRYNYRTLYNAAMEHKAAQTTTGCGEKRSAALMLHIGSATHKTLFKYIEHARRKQERGEIGAVEQILLSEIECTIGNPLMGEDRPLRTYFPKRDDTPPRDYEAYAQNAFYYVQCPPQAWQFHPLREKGKRFPKQTTCLTISRDRYGRPDEGSVRVAYCAKRGGEWIWYGKQYAAQETREIPRVCGYIEMAEAKGC